MLFDSHTHTKFSADSEMIAEEALEMARRMDLGLVFTEHLDFDAPAAGEEEFLIDPEEYWRTYEPLRDGRLSLGVEMGLMKSAREKNRDFSRRVPFDFIIGSIHFLWGGDLYYADTFKGKSKDEAYREYFTVMKEEIYGHPFINALAHIDFVARNAPYENTEITYAHYTEEIDGVLQALIDTDTAFEINTRRLANPRALKELVPIYGRYREMGGRYVTIGSDAHNIGVIGANFDTAIEMANELDLTIVTYREGKPVKCWQ